MQLIDKCKVYFHMPVFKDIGDEEKLKEEAQLEMAVQLAEMRMMGFVAGAIVALHTCKNKEEPIHWGVVIRVNEKWPDLNGKFMPMEVRWFNGSHYGSNRYSPDDVFLIQEGPSDEILSGVTDYNTDTSNIFKS